MDKKIETYINQIIKELNCDENERKEIFDEIKDHLKLLKNEYIEQGFTNDEATQKALKSFGNQKKISKGINKSLSPYYKIIKITTWTLFCLYSFIILFKLLFQRIYIRITDYVDAVSFNYPDFNRYFFTPPNSNGFFDIEVWKLNSNIIPFRNIFEYITGSDRFNLDIIINNTMGNILIFIPLGIFLPILFKKYKALWKISISSAIISFSIEALQFILQIGQFDIDDIILNTIGCVVGYFIIIPTIKITMLTKEFVYNRVVVKE